MALLQLLLVKIVPAISGFFKYFEAWQLYRCFSSVLLVASVERVLLGLVDRRGELHLRLGLQLGRRRATLPAPETANLFKFSDSI